MKIKLVSYLVVFFTIVSCNAQQKNVFRTMMEMYRFASGCFWCTEHVFEAVIGVDKQYLFWGEM
jgi:peptide-methionine (S)-S-oxide reductase